jgi:hypothetical protein
MIAPRRFLAAPALALVVALTGCGVPTDSSNTTDTPTHANATTKPKTTKPEADASTKLSCEHFRNVMGDVGNGLLTESELRDKTKQFYDTGRLSEVPKVRVAVQDMLAAITGGDTDAYLTAAKSMSAACRTVGE